MMAVSEEAFVELLDAEGRRVPSKVLVTPGPPSELEVADTPLGGLRVKGADLFDCLCELRTRLKPLGVLVLCQGACRNVYPSSMSRQMSAGRMAYRLQLGQQAKREDLTDIFSSAEEQCIVSVAEQRAYFETWIESLE